MDQIEAVHDQPAIEWREPLFLAATGNFVWLVSIAILMFVSLAYWRRYDEWAAVTLYPVWCWAALGLFLVFIGSSRWRWRKAVVLVALWAAFLFAFADAPWSLVRAFQATPARGELRVATLNCAGIGGALQKVVVHQPDIVLVQESPLAEELAAVARELFGDEAKVVRGPDASILARGDVTTVEVPAPYRENFVHARVTIDGRATNVISLRLYPCPVRIDVWSSDCWKSYEANRVTRRRQLERVANYVSTLPEDEPLIVGGDFNCPPGDAVLWLLEPRLTDAFTVAGRGWGATIIDIAGVSMIRIDQIWTSRQLTATKVFAAPALPSDHRMVVADFLVE
jgi:vancomycin resistance protein VanJ